MSSNAKKNRAFYKIVWKNAVENGRPRMIIWRMRSAGWITKVTNTDSEYVTFIASPRQQRLHERSSALIYMHISCLIVVNSAIEN
jgi:hypothetical protein